MPKKKQSEAPDARHGRSLANGDAAAAVVPGGKAAGPEFFDPRPIVEAMGVYCTDKERYLIKLPDGRWAEWNKEAMIDKIIKTADGMGLFVSPVRREKEALSDVREVLMFIREERYLDFVFSGLPGYRSGMHLLGTGEKVLVKTEPRFVEPVEGEWPLIGAICEGLLDERPELRQRDYFYSWLKVSVESVMNGEPGQWRPSQALIFAGPIASGKGFLQEHVITPLLGGRQADPGKMLFGQDEYNSDCWKAEHLALGEVPMPSQKMHDRIALSEQVKQIVANTLHRMRVMRVDPLALFPFWRLTISVNDHPDKLRNLPLITDDFRDKVLLFHCRKMGMPMPTASLQERMVFARAVAAEVPHFLHWLIHTWEIPKDLLTYEDGTDATRFGFREFHHPIIREGLFEDTPDAEFVQLVDLAEFTSLDWNGVKKLWQLPQGTLNAVSDDEAGLVWHERAQTLHRLLTGDAGYTCSVAVMAKKFLDKNSVARMLGRLAKDDAMSRRIEKADVTAWRGWRVMKPVHE